MSSLEKLKIYKWDLASGDVSGSPFEVMFNPRSFISHHANQYVSDEGVPTPGGEGSDTDTEDSTTQVSSNFLGSKSSNLDLTLIFDGSGVKNYGWELLFDTPKTVSEQLSEFFDLCFYVQESTHRPNDLKIQWGIIDFVCRLKSNSVTYSLFDSDGNPLRAEMSVVFEAIDGASVTSLGPQELSSPDLSHTHLVKAGDTLPLLVKEIYGSSKYYLQIARINGLNNFRQLEPGQTLIFPPLEQSV